MPTTPSDALAKFERETFDMVVTDYRMEGMNGVELARQLRQKAPELPIIVVSGLPLRRGLRGGQCVA